MRKKDVITIGMPISLSGRYALQGRQCCAGLECYVADVNGAGGILLRSAGRRLPVALKIYDDRSDAPAVRRLTERLVEEEVDLLFGAYGSGLAVEAAAVAAAHQRVLWNHSGAAEVDRRVGLGWVVSLLTPASRYFHSVLDLCKARDATLRSIILVHATTGFATAVAEGVRTWAAHEAVALSGRAYRSGAEVSAACLNDAGLADVILGVGRIEDDLLLARALCKVRPRSRAVGLVAAGIARFRDEIGTAANGFLAPTQWEPAVRYSVDAGASAEQFVQRYLGTAGVPLDYPAAQAYAAGVVAQRCIEDAGILDQHALRAAAARCRMTTLYGTFGLDPATGEQSAHSMLVVQWQQDSKRVVWPPELAEAEPIPGPFWR
jgi:branched-chain amino acid transport system substrate-binding protein